MIILGSTEPCFGSSEPNFGYLEEGAIKNEQGRVGARCRALKIAPDPVGE